MKIELLRPVEKSRSPTLGFLLELAILAPRREVSELFLEVSNLLAELVNLLLFLAALPLVGCNLPREVSNLFLSLGELIIEVGVLLTSPFVHRSHLLKVVLHAIDSCVKKAHSCII